MPLAFDDPMWLVALLLVPLVVWTGRRVFRDRQRRGAVWVRSAAVVLLVLAVAGPRWHAAGSQVDVVFLVDASDSVGGTRDAVGWVGQALDHMPDGSRAALALFGADAQLEYTLQSDPPRGDVFTIVDPSASDVARALRLGQGVLGSENRRRAVLLTDGLQTRGDAARTAEELAEAGVHVDVVTVSGGLAADVLVEEVRAPSRVREGESFDVVGVLRNTSDDPAEVVVTVARDDETIHREEVTAPPGRTEVAVPQTASGSGTVRYEVRLSSPSSAIDANDVGRAAVHVDGPPSVLVLEGEDGAGRQLTDALIAAGVPADLRPVGNGVPTLDRLLAHEATVLVDVHADRIGDAGMRTLDAYVRDAGRGLVAVGGEDAYGMGDYDGTLLEDLLPVFARVEDPERRPSVAEALLVDVSGSMAACHCQSGGFGSVERGGMAGQEGGVNKTDISKEAVARAIDALEADDTVGVLAFNTQSSWVIPLQKLPSDAVVDEGLAKLHPEGGTAVPQAVREAIAGLKDTDARLRHIVLFSDGFTEDMALVEVAEEAAAEGITLSVVGTGEGTGEVLEEMAAAGGGRYYPGRDLSSIPDILVSEVQFVARPIINEGNFVPTVTGIAAPTEDLDSSPPLLGYLATTAKPAARTLLTVGEDRDPLLATWQAGLGTAVAWTSDASPRWSSHWVTWERFSRFWADTVKSTFPGDPDPRYDAEVTSTPDGLQVRLAGAATIPADAAAAITVTDPDGDRTELTMNRTSLDSYEATVPGGGEGVYAVSLRLHDGETDLYRDTVTAIRSYSPEYGSTHADRDLAQRIADAGHGRLDPSPDEAFAPAGLPRGEGSHDITAWFVLGALLLLPLEIGLRRLRLERGDLARLTTWVRRGRRDGRAVVARRDGSEDPDPPDVASGGGVRGLLDAKRRARERRKD